MIPSLSDDARNKNKSVAFLKEPAPNQIQTLLSRNELIQKFAEKKYLLNSYELNDLIGEENYLSIKKYSFFEWRNWRLIPKNEKYWIIENKNT